jgi:hypothetical protein
MRGQRRPVLGDQIDPAVGKASFGARAVYLHDQRSAAVAGDGESLRGPHSPETGRQHSPAGERAFEMSRRDCAKRLVGEAENPLGADVEPAGRRHLAIHREADVLQAAKRILVRPRGDDHRRRDEHARGVLVGRDHSDRLPRLNEQSLIRPQLLEGRDDLRESLVTSRRPSASPVHDERLGVLGNGRIEVVEETAKRTFLLPTAAAEVEPPGRAAKRRLQHRLDPNAGLLLHSTLTAVQSNWSSRFGFQPFTFSLLRIEYVIQ